VGTPARSTSSRKRQPSWLPQLRDLGTPTPPFPEYSSGHSNFSAAGAEILKRFTRSDRFGGSVTLPHGSSKIEPGAVPAADLTLSWATFSDAASQAGISRRYGGIHFEQADLDARATGRTAAQRSYGRKRKTTGKGTNSSWARSLRGPGEAAPTLHDDYPAVTDCAGHCATCCSA
jgi:VCPO second helical-bundle domain